MKLSNNHNLLVITNEKIEGNFGMRKKMQKIKNDNTDVELQSLDQIKK